MTKLAKPQSVRKLDRLRSWLALAGLGTMVGLLPILSNFLSNRFEVSVQDLMLPLLAVLAVASAIALVFNRYYRRNPLGGSLATLVAAILLTNGYDDRLGSVYPLFRAFLPLPKLGPIENDVFSLFFIILIFLLAVASSRLLVRWIEQRNANSRDILIALRLAIAVTFVLLFLPASKTIISAWPQYFYKPPALAAQTKIPSKKPDIYYIVMEDYANQTQLAAQFGFDNTNFTKFLTDNGYYTNPNAQQNYPYTTMSIASTLSADYNTSIINRFKNASFQTIIPYHRAVQYSNVVSSLKSMGYQYDEIGNWYETSDRGPLADHFYMPDRRLTLFGHLNYIDSFTQSELSQSVFWRFLESGISIGHFVFGHYQGMGQVQLTGDSITALKSLATAPAGGRFIFAHLIIPHEPYYFNADGSISPNAGSDDNGETIKQKYVGQVKYINAQMELILSQIKQKSMGQAVVVLQSDEGPHPEELDEHLYDQDSANNEINNHNMNLLSNADLKLKYGAMSAYSIPAASASDLATGANSVDVFRLIFDRYFSANLNILPECYYAYPNGRNKPFTYEDITNRLTGSANPVCAPDGTGAK